MSCCSFCVKITKKSPEVFRKYKLIEDIVAEYPFEK